MRTFVCDACDKVIDEPYEMKMKEFYVGCSFEYFGVLPNPSKRKIVVHLCDDCFHGLSLIAQKKCEVQHE